jgi:DNA polymerase-4
MTHTLFSDEIKGKYFPLPVYDMFMIGFKTCMKLYNLGYRTIGDVANGDPALLRKHFKLFGLLIWSNANGIDHSPVRPYEARPRGIGNGMTLPADAASPEDAFPFLLSLCEISSQRLRASGMRAGVVSVGLRTNDFVFSSRQKTLSVPTQGTKNIYRMASCLLRDLWRGEPARGVSVRLSRLSPAGSLQLDMLGNEELRQQKIDGVVDSLRKKYGDSCLLRASSLHSGAPPVAVTTHKDYPKIKPNIMDGG